MSNPDLRRWIVSSVILLFWGVVVRDGTSTRIKTNGKVHPREIPGGRTQTGVTTKEELL